MINPHLLDLDLEDSDGASEAPTAPTITDNLLVPNEQFYELCSRLNEGQQYLFNFCNFVCSAFQINLNK